MSMIKTQIPDGFATIRRRGLHRSKSRCSDQQQFQQKLNRRTNVMRSDSGPLFENNNDLFYKNDLMLSSPENDYYDATKTFTQPMSSFKGGRDKSYEHIDSLTHSNECFDTSPYELMLPPLKSPQYINELNAIRSQTYDFEQKPQISNGHPLSLYSRPDSPKYGKIAYRSSASESSENDSSNSPTYLTNHRIPISTISNLNKPKYTNIDYGYVLEKRMITTKPPLKSTSLQYRKSFSHPTKIIYEETSFNRLANKPNGNTHNSKNSVNSDNTNYSDKPTNNSRYQKIHENASLELLNLDTSSKHVLVNKVVNGYDRRYATLAHPKDKYSSGNTTSSLYHLNQSSSSLTNNRFLEHSDPLDYKIGCQTMLRSKPVIPWYELAIKKDHRQSCPPFQAHVVSAFEQSLTNMTSRLQSITATTEKKDSEITEMRQTIELLRKQSIQAGLTTAHMQSMGGNQINGHQKIPTASSTPKTSSLNSVANSLNDPQYSTPPSLSAANGLQIPRHHSSESMCSLNSISSGSSAHDKKKKKGWLRSSFTKAFSRNAKISKTSRHYLTNDMSVNTTIPETSICGSLPPTSPSKINGSPLKVNGDGAVETEVVEAHPIVEDLKKQLREKDLVLTDIRLEALSSASQLENLKDTVMQMRQEMMSLKHNNDRLQRMVTTRSLAGSEASLGNNGGTPVSPSGSMGEPRRYSLADGGLLRQPLDLPTDLDELDEENIPPAPAPEPPPDPLSPSAIAQLCPALEHQTEITAEEVADPIDGKKISIAVYLGQPESFTKYVEELTECDDLYTSSSNHENGLKENGLDNSNKSFPDPSQNEFIIAYTYISGKTTWQNLDYIVRKTFKDYLSRIDPGTNLGLNTDSITSYHLGEAKRGPEMGFPELLPCGYIIGSVKTLHICLQGVGCLAFDCLIPRSIAHRYISLLTEHRRLILCGPSGTGKSFLARKLAEFLVAKSGRGNPAEAIATFNVDHKSSKELQQYLSHVVEQASIANSASEELPSVIILDNLHHASALGDVFSCLLSSGPATKLPCIIGTMSQATCNTTNLQLHHNFRWVLTANHMEPVKGFLGRFLRRRLFQLEMQTLTKQTQLEKVFKWLPTVWQHINSFLETHSSSDVTIGPRLFLACPLEQTDSQVWFQDVWNYHLAQYLVEAVREGVQLYGRRGGAWVDPCQFVRETYPWPVGPTTVPTLRQITADDVGLDAGAPNINETQDPLLNMLMRLQEAANYNGNQEQDSDCASLDSNLTHDSSAGVD